jgi:hypothetical protein
MVTGDGSDVGVAAEERGQVFSVQRIRGFRAMQSGEIAGEFTSQNGFDGTAAILEDVIVNDDEARLRRSEDGFGPLDRC